MEGFARQNGFFGLSGLGPASGSSGPSPLDLVNAAFADFIAHDAVIAAWNVADVTTASMSSSRTMLAEVVPGGPVGQFFDQKGSFDLVAGDGDSKRPFLTGGLLAYDGIDDTLEDTTALPSLTISSMALYRGTKTSTTNAILNITAAPALVWSAGNGSSPISGGTGSAFVDGASQGTRDTLAAAVADGAKRLLEWRGIAGSEFTNGIRFGHGSSPVLGDFVPFALLDEAQGDLAAARTSHAAYRTLLYDYLGI